MKTVLQELIEELKEFKKIPMVDQPTIDAAIGFAEFRIEKEKQQIIEVYSDGGEKGFNKFGENAEYYYNITFKI